MLAPLRQAQGERCLSPQIGSAQTHTLRAVEHGQTLQRQLMWVQGTPCYICSGASMPMRRRHRPRVMAAAFTSLRRALVRASSPGVVETTRHCW